MVSFSRMISSVSVALALVSVSSVLAAPVPEVSSLSTRDITVPSPAFVIYSDLFTPDPNVLGDPSKYAGYNVINLSFLTVSKGPFDQVLRWQQLPADTKATVKAQYAAAGIQIMASAFGQTDAPTTAGLDPAAIAAQFGQFVLDNGLDGIDVDYEDLDAINKGDGAGEAWVAAFTRALRATLPQGQFVLSHAPIAPWLAPNAAFAAGAYVQVNKEVGDLIDFYNIQFYNQGTNYQDCDSLLNAAQAPFTGSSLFEIASNGFALDKLVIGKPATAADVGPPPSGLMDPATLGTCVDQAATKGWKGGVMVFQDPHADSAWIQAAKGTAFQ
ncbi:chitinase [Epithele typhae]|uniref:chitinase n=1 Tax=Epithele typhae TaxID=378194 RepID=UPI0020086AEF|nr:chitinase [Epithele typhae]KAH9924654.1 chitinase [Epithele typhae]